jgi:hypothetical protein
VARCAFVGLHGILSEDKTAQVSLAPSTVSEIL